MSSATITEGMLATLLKATVLISTAVAALTLTSCASAPASTRLDRGHNWLMTKSVEQPQHSAAAIFDETFGLDSAVEESPETELGEPKNDGSSTVPESRPAASDQHGHHHGEQP